MANPIQIKTWDEFETHKQDPDKLVVVCLSASACGQCVGIGEKLATLSSNPEFAKCKFLEIDADETDVADSLGVYEYPVFHFYHKGKKLIKEERGADVRVISEVIDDLIKNNLN